MKSSNSLNPTLKPAPLAPLIVVSCYMFLVIARPWESISYLEGIPIERSFALFMILICLITGKFRIVSSPVNKWAYGLLVLHFVLAPFAFNTGFAIDQGIEYAKMIVLYLLMLSVAEDERSLRILLTVFVFSTFFYMVHSLWEYNNGRYVYRMGIKRMVGVGGYMSDPNAFGATIVLSLPFVYALFKTEVLKSKKNLYYLYFALAIACVVLTGSRSAAIALVFLFVFFALSKKGKYRFLALSIVLIAGCLVWFNMPEDKQDRIRTLWDEDAGPASAHSSAAGRMEGWHVSWEMFKSEPFTGVGPGGNNFMGYRWRYRIDERVDPERGSPSATQSHILYGQVLAEQGLFGALLFAGFVLSTALTSFSVLKRKSQSPCSSYLLRYLSGAILFSLLLLLLLGFGGHNFYRPLWLWLAAWAGVSYRLSKVKTKVPPTGELYVQK